MSEGATILAVYWNREKHGHLPPSPEAATKADGYRGRAVTNIKDRKMVQKINIISPRAVVRHGVRAMIEPSEQFQIGKEFDCINTAYTELYDQDGAIILLDLSAAGSKAEISQRLNKLIINQHLIAICDIQNIGLAMALAEAGCTGVLAAEFDAAALQLALQRTLKGFSFIDQTLSEKIVFGLRQQRLRESRKSELRLSVREQQVADRIKAGLSNQLISQDLGISERTVKHYVSVLKDKLNACNRTQIAVQIYMLEAA